MRSHRHARARLYPIQLSVDAGAGPRAHEAALHLPICGDGICAASTALMEETSPLCKDMEAS